MRPPSSSHWTCCLELRQFPARIKHFRHGERNLHPSQDSLESKTASALRLAIPHTLNYPPKEEHYRVPRRHGVVKTAKNIDGMHRSEAAPTRLVGPRPFVYDSPSTDQPLRYSRRRKRLASGRSNCIFLAFHFSVVWGKRDAMPPSRMASVSGPE